MAAIVEVVVGVIFVFILLSILVTEINSLISRAARLRSRNLRAALDGMIEDPVTRAMVYTHPLIQLVKAETVLSTQRITEAEARQIARGKIGSVDFIAPATFVDVALETVRTGSQQRLYGAMLNIIDGMPRGPERRGLRQMAQGVVKSGKGMGRLRSSLPHLRQPQYRGALYDALHQLDEQVVELGLRHDANVALMAGLRQEDSPHFRGSLAAVMANSSDEADAREKLETWFNGAMMRASAAYGARMKRLSIVVALFIALVVNIDTLHIARTLWEDPIRRQQISSEVSATVGGAEADLSAGTVIEGDFVASEAKEGGNVGDIIETGAALANQLQDIQNLSLPIGWTHDDLAGRSVDDRARSNPNNLWNYHPDNNPDGWLLLLLGKLAGIAATVIAAAQGAPFWFGIVNRILSR